MTLRMTGSKFFEQPPAVPVVKGFIRIDRIIHEVHKAAHTPEMRSLRANIEDRVFLAPVGSMKRIVQDIAAGTPYSIDQICGPSRMRKLIRVRFKAIWHCCEAGFSTTQIARFFGDRDHTTIMHARNRYQAMIDAGEVT